MSQIVGRRGTINVFVESRASNDKQKTRRKGNESSTLPRKKNGYSKESNDQQDQKRIHFNTLSNRAVKTNFLFPACFAYARYSSWMIGRFLNLGDHGKPKSGKIKGRCQPMQSACSTYCKRQLVIKNNTGDWSQSESAKKTKVFTVTCVDVFILYRSNSQVVQFSTKGSICFTKLFLLCNWVHSYSPKQSPIVFLQLMYKFSWLALNRKSENYRPFRHVLFSQPGMVRPISIKRIEPLCLSDSSRVHYPLDNTYHWTFRTK